MTDREPLSKSTRFEVLKRDKFRCRYCGANPENGVLQVDHVIPVADGGTNDLLNLVTACAACNLGKSDRSLGDVAPSSEITAAQVREQAEQITEWAKAQQELLDAKAKLQQQMVNLWCNFFGEKECDADVAHRLLVILRELPMDRLCEALDIVARKRIWSDTQRLRYLYGILRRWREAAGETPLEAAEA